MRELAVVLFLTVNSWADIRKREIPLLLAVVFGSIGFAWSLLQGQINWICLGTGAAFLLVSLATEGAVGMGDVWVLMALGTIMDISEFLFMIGIGLMFAAVWGMILMIVFKKTRNAEMPFLPFLLLGYIGGLCL